MGKSGSPQKNRGKRGARSGARPVRTVIVLLLVCAVAAGGYWWYKSHGSQRKADAVMEQLELMVPGISSDSEGRDGVWQESLASVSIEGLDIVGALQIPALDILAPVSAEYADEESIAYCAEGTAPAKDGFRIEGSRLGLFSDLSSLKPGDRVTFTDIYGVRSAYTVTTQYHLKNWDEGDNDLLLCYKTDSDTYFVVGCTETQ